MQSACGIGLLGCGTVGSGVATILAQGHDLVSRRAGAPVEIRKVLVRDPARSRQAPLPPRCFTADPGEILNDPAIEVVVEVMGGLTPARELIREALQRGKTVVTANKEVLAKHGPELFEQARRRGIDLFFEASVAGGIPVVKALRESLAANRVRRLMGIINGTTNYILTRMSAEGIEFEQALREAQARGYAEADPSSDVEGKDAAYKLVILASLAFETQLPVENVFCEGIGRITPEDLAHGAELGYVLKLLAIAKEEQGAIEARVHPTFIPHGHPLAAVKDVYNAIFVEGDAVGELMLYGRGAGSLPTASAVVADLIDAVRRRRARAAPAPWAPPAAKPLRSIAESVSRFYISLKVVDRPGVLAGIAAAFGQEDVSIESMIQKGRGQDPVGLVFVTHESRERNVRAALEKIARLPVVREVHSLIRVEAGS